MNDWTDSSAPDAVESAPDDTVCRRFVDNTSDTATPQKHKGSRARVDGRRPPKRKTKLGRGENAYLSRLIAGGEAAESVMAALALRRAKPVESWPGFAFTPPGSALDLAVNLFRRKTDIPLEIPFTALMSLISAVALQRGVTIRFADTVERMDIWTVLLAASGSSKTFATNKLKRWAAKAGVELAELAEPSSAAAYVEQMAQDEPPCVWFRDEFGKALRLWATPGGPLFEMQDYILRTYDHGTLERKTLKGSLRAASPAIVIHATSVFDTFRHDIPPGALVDGLAQRFGYMLAPADAARPMRDFPDYSFSDTETDEIVAALAETFESIEDDAELVVSPDGEAAFRRGFKRLCDDSLPPSFVRRVLWRTIKFAGIYHIACRRSGHEIDKYDFQWAFRLTERAIGDLRALLDDADMTEIERIVRNAETIKARVEAQGGVCTPRDLVRGVRGLRSSQDAKALLAFIGSGSAKK